MPKPKFDTWQIRPEMNKSVMVVTANKDDLKWVYFNGKRVSKVDVSNED